MVLTTLGRTAARSGAFGQMVSKAPQAAPKSPSNMLQKRFAGGYDWNMGVPGSRIRNPSPETYNDVKPGMGFGWWALITTSSACFFWGNTYDTSRGIVVAIGLFGPNMPM
eukprot:TRINITY_DN354_c0_g4_i1.p1 TRINITY_DN354_c0_g4~~TRINITY_DN354_c0_g4_i1.p1  ORF type:complete len:110 (-),score=33.09 TRINITY_DN354_c0_g4_i1:118-447(-)